MKAFRVLFPFLHFFSKFDLKKFIVEVMTSCMTPNKTMKTLTLPQRVKRFPVLQTHVPWPCFCRWLHIFGGLLLFSVPGARSRLSIQCFSSFSYNLKKKMLGEDNYHIRPACLPAPRGVLCMYSCVFNIPKYLYLQNCIYSILSFIEKSGPIKLIIFSLLKWSSPHLKCRLKYFNDFFKLNFENYTFRNLVF